MMQFEFVSYFISSTLVLSTPVLILDLKLDTGLFIILINVVFNSKTSKYHINFHSPLIDIFYHINSNVVKIYFKFLKISDQ